MNAKELISTEIPSLSVTQTGRDAFYLLGEHHIKHLPVVKEGKLLGVISEEDIFNHKIYDPIGSYDFSLIRRFAVRDNDHLFEVIRIMVENRLTVIPVMDEFENYLGLITQNGILRAFAHTASLAEPGAVLILEMHRRDYSLSNIARYIEEEDAKMLGAFVSSTQDSESMELTIKVNRQDVSRIAASLERHGYVVRNAFAEIDHTDGMKDRYESLLHYLNI